MHSAHSSSWNESFVSTSKDLLKNRNWTFPVVCYFTWKLEFISNVLWMIVETLCYWVISCQKGWLNWILLSYNALICLISHVSCNYCAQNFKILKTIHILWIDQSIKEMKEKKTYIHYILYTMPKINKIVPQDYDI